MSEVVKAGKLFVFSGGEYSDYSYEGHFLALEDLSTETFQAVVDLLKKDLLEGKLTYYDKVITAESDEWEISIAIKERFVGKLVTTGKVMVIDCEEIHIGSYGRLEIAGVHV